MGWDGAHLTCKKRRGWPRKDHLCDTMQSMSIRCLLGSKSAYHKTQEGLEIAKDLQVRDKKDSERSWREQTKVKNNDIYI